MSGLFPFGVRIIRNDLLTIGPFEDWSDVRSPGRARRRRAKYRQRIRFYHKPDPKLFTMPDGTIVGHPITIARLLAELRRRDPVSTTPAPQMTNEQEG